MHTPQVIKVAKRVSSHPATKASLPYSGLPEIPDCPPHFLLKDKIPSHITVLEHSEGIDPYEFLKEELK